MPAPAPSIQIPLVELDAGFWEKGHPLFSKRFLPMALLLIGDPGLERCHRYHPCRGALYFESLTGGVASLNHRLQAGKPLASGVGRLAISDWVWCLAWNVLHPT